MQHISKKGKRQLKRESRKVLLLIRPHLRRVYRLEDLLKRITPRNVHEWVDFGGPVCRKAL